MELAVRHRTSYLYTTPASQVALLLRLQPATLDGQQPRNWEVTVNGMPVRNFQANAFGDGEAFFQHREPVGEVEIVAAGTVTTRDRHGVVSGFSHEVPLAVYLRQTALTRPDPAIAALAQDIGAGDTLSRLHELSARIRERVVYCAGSTSMASTAGTETGS